MKSRRPFFRISLVVTLALCALLSSVVWVHAQSDPLPSWNDGAIKQSIVDFVEKVTKEGSSDFVPVAERIATFDNDGTLWCEQPIPVQLYFALDRVKALAPSHPEWKTQEPFASILKGDLKTALAGGDHALVELLMAHRVENPEPLLNLRPDVPLELAAIVEQMTAKDPALRFQTAKDVADGLRAWLRDSGSGGEYSRISALMAARSSDVAFAAVSASAGAGAASARRGAWKAATATKCRSPSAPLNAKRPGRTAEAAERREGSAAKTGASKSSASSSSSSGTKKAAGAKETVTQPNATLAVTPLDAQRLTLADKQGELRSLFGGGRLPKDALRIETYGTVDELNSALGIARAWRPQKELDLVLLDHDIRYCHL